ncbi:MAG: hypothetical protein ACJAVK_002080 [Akkermansiaceae bacterium]|jgi:hypothetical protein
METAGKSDPFFLSNILESFGFDQRNRPIGSLSAEYGALTAIVSITNKTSLFFNLHSGNSDHGIFSFWSDPDSFDDP